MNILIDGSDIKKALQGKTKTAIYCMGEYGKQCFELCVDNGIKIDSFIDGNTDGEYKGVKAIMPCPYLSDYTIVICNRLNYLEIYDELIAIGVPRERIYIYMPRDSIYLHLSDMNRALTESVAMLKKLEDLDAMLRNNIRAQTPLPMLQFDYSIVRHCNLNCKGCLFFSPLADKWFANIEEFKKDMHRVSELFGNDVSSISLLGGEPLLHPDITEFMKIARGYFKDARICITTNGLLLLKKDEEFWQCCRDNSIDIRVTEYPINLNFEAMQKKAESYGIRYYNHYRTRLQKKNYFFKNPIDISGTTGFSENFSQCSMANYSIQLAQGGNLYTCPVATRIALFNNYFKQNIVQSEKDYINIHSDTTAEEILDFLAKPIPMCRYCGMGKRERGVKWEQSKRDIKEWT